MISTENKEPDEIDMAGALLAGANLGVTKSEESVALATIAIGQLLLYFAKEQRDATQKLEAVLKDKMESRLKEFNDFLNTAGLGGK